MTNPSGWYEYDPVMLLYCDDPRNKPAVKKKGIVVEPPPSDAKPPYWMLIDVEGKEYMVRGAECVKPDGPRPSMWVSPKKLAERIVRMGKTMRELEALSGPCGRHATLPLREEELHMLCKILEPLIPMLSAEKQPCAKRKDANGS